ncbi:MAG: glucokinase [Pseudomonadota bacterium]|jgi:glucokinase
MSEQSLCLIADIGGTNARFALVGPDGAHGEAVLTCADHPSLQDAARAYLAGRGLTALVKRAAFAVASPVTGDVVRMTNLPWEFSIATVRAELGLDRLDVINDFTAVALAVPELAMGDRVQIGRGDALADAPIAVLGAGSGLGVSALVRSGGGWTALATEGGHVTMPAVDDREVAVLAVLRRHWPHVSAERLLSGPGIVNLHEALATIDGRPSPALTAAEISTRALDGSDPACGETLGLFCAMLGTVAGNLALSIGARGGVFVAGGIAPKILPFLQDSRFRDRFEAKGRMSAFLGPIPTYVVVHPYPAFLGLQAQLKAA